MKISSPVTSAHSALLGATNSAVLLAQASGADSQTPSDTATNPASASSNPCAAVIAPEVAAPASWVGIQLQAGFPPSAADFCNHVNKLMGTNALVVPDKFLAPAVDVQLPELAKATVTQRRAVARQRKKKALDQVKHVATAHAQMVIEWDGSQPAAHSKSTAGSTSVPKKARRIRGAGNESKLGGLQGLEISGPKLTRNYENAKVGSKEEWLTPPDLIKALGEFDLDPCAPRDAIRPWPTAKKHYSVDDDGLSREWEGRIWCNPPYGRKSPDWIKRCAEHNNGMLLIYARVETSYFFEWVWEKASGVLFLKKRLSFFHVTGAVAGTATAPNVLVAYGVKNALALRDCARPGQFFMLDGPRPSQRLAASARVEASSVASAGADFIEA